MNKGWGVLFAGCVALLSAGCAPRQGNEEPVQTARQALINVTWTDVVGSSASGNDLTKTAGAGWNAGAASNETLSGDGYVELTTAEATTDKMAGLSHVDPATNYAAIDFGLYLSSGGGVNVYEDGTFRASVGSYAAGDVLRIQVTSGQVTYLQNGSLLYTSTKTPAATLLVGAALYTTGATLDNVVLNPAGSFWQDVVGVNTSGTSMTKTGAAGWNAGAATVATLAADGYAQFTTAETTTDKMAGLSHADPAQNFAAIDFAFYLSSSGNVNVYEDGAVAGSFGTYAAGDVFQIQVAGTHVTYLQNGNLLYTSTKTPTQPLLFGTSLYTTGATIDGAVLTPFWQDAVGVTTSGSSMTKTGAAGWNAGAASVATIAADGYAQFTTAETTTDKMVGLSHADPAQSYAAIDYALYLTSGGGVDVYEDGTFRGSFDPYAANDVFKIQVAGTQVSYLKNGTVFSTSAKVPTHPLLFATSLYSTGATVDNVVVYSAPIYWQDVAGVATSGTSMTKIAASGWGNAGAASLASLTGDGSFSFTTAEKTTDKVAGLSHADPAQNYAAIDFGLYLSSGAGIGIYEDGVSIGTFGTYAANDVFKIQVAGTQVAYLRNGNLLYTSTKAPTLPLLFATAPYTKGATLNNVSFTSGPIYWQDPIGVTTAGPSMTKTGAVGWNAGAVSVTSLSGWGYALFTTAEANTDKIAGLSHVDPAGSYTAIDFGIYLTSGGVVSIYEDGAYTGTFGTYAAGDQLGVQVVGTQVTYLKNGSAFLTSGKTPASTLFFGTSLFSTGATIEDVTVVATGSGVVCGVTCPAGTVLSGYLCIPLDDPNYGCVVSSACPSPKNASNTCVGGACGFTCDPEWADCNHNPSDGCEADLTSTATCGACNVQCSSGQVCLAGACVTTCSPPLTNCGGSCVNLETDANHCGGCTTQCSAPDPGIVASCSGGSCGTYSCTGGRALCNWVCVDTNDDPKNCGGCSIVCPGTGAGPGSCTNGVCAPCAAGFTRCGGECTDLAHDGANCGTCGNVCPHSFNGNYGTCEASGCLSAPATLASGLNNVTQIAIDGTYVYWTESGAGNVTKMPLAGGTPIPIATGQNKPLHLALDASNLYWTNNLGAAVMSVPIAGGSPTVFAGAMSPTHVVIDTDTVYWDDSNGVVWSRKKVGGSPVMLASYGGTVTSLAVSAAYVYVSSGSSIHGIPKTGSAPITYSCTGTPGSACTPTVIAIDGTTVYISGPVQQVDVSTTLDFVFDESSPTQQYQFGYDVGAMAFDASYRYMSGYACVGACFSFQPVLTRAQACGSPSALASEPSTNFLALAHGAAPSVATDSGSWVYWTDGANIGRIAK